MKIFDEIIKFEYKNNMGLVNVTDGFFALYLNYLYRVKNSILLVTSNAHEANKLYKILTKSNDDVLIFLADDLLLKNVIDSTPQAKADRLDVLNQLVKDNKKIVITDINGYLKKLESFNNYKNHFLNINIRNSINIDSFLSSLYDFGYERVDIVNKTGDVAVRGFVIDIFPFGYENPVRIELFGDEIESIRIFDGNSQVSIEKIDELKVYSFNENFNNNYDTIYSYMDNPVVVFHDYNQLVISYNQLVEEYLNYYNEYEKPFIDFNVDDVKEKIYSFSLDNDVSNIKLDCVIDYNTRKVDKFNENFDLINNFFSNKINNNKTIILSLNNVDKNSFLNNINVDYVLTDIDNIYKNKLNIIKDFIYCGFEFDNYIFLTENEMFKSSYSKVRKKNYRFGSKINSLSNLEVGDYVVHSLYGIGIYNGIKTLKKKGLLLDYIEVLYDGNDKLYIPASKIDLITKYSGKDGYSPKINGLNNSSWNKTKQRVREKIKYEAARLLKVQAERNLKKGFAFSEDCELQRQFDSEFIYDETIDQLRVWEQIKKDMESVVPMDRILCGDVGYGKTEIAFRAMFKAVLDHKQVMYLCPTTLLSKQQYESAIERFKNFSVNIANLNRFTSSKDTKKILEDFGNGKIDILFGTHRILSDDVISSDLGLLVIDEEQRFGVLHKEKIKEYKANIDVLTLTATPIPRTLQMAMLGIKNLSLIETPPKNRHAVQTYVTQYDKRLIKNIIYKELSRDGQVFILYNRVAEIETFANIISSLVPDARVVFAHGKMNKNELEDKMNSFVNREYDVLVCTTIIETGVDIPNANSLIIIDADRFGLSQLYQIRGRVGRSDKIAYAYLFYGQNKMLNDLAIKRLKVIKEFTELGSGFSIASRDLSIRGAGDILGSEQAGFIDSVGIDLYLKMLNEEMLKIKGLYKEEVDESDNSVIEVSNHIKNELVEEENLKIEIHKLINSIDSLEKLEEIKLLIKDRFGRVDNDLILYMNQELFDKLIKIKGVDEVSDNNMYVEIRLNKDVSDKINYEDLFVLSIDISRDFIFSYKNKCIYIKILKNKVEEHPILYFNKLLEKM